MPRKAPAPAQHAWQRRPVRCGHCGGEESGKGVAMLRSGFEKPFWNVRGHAYTMFECADCGHTMLSFPGSVYGDG